MKCCKIQRFSETWWAQSQLVNADSPCHHLLCFSPSHWSPGCLYLIRLGSELSRLMPFQDVLWQSQKMPRVSDLKWGTFELHCLPSWHIPPKVFCTAGSNLKLVHPPLDAFPPFSILYSNGVMFMSHEMVLPDVQVDFLAIFWAYAGHLPWLAMSALHPSCFILLHLCQGFSFASFHMWGRMVHSFTHMSHLSGCVITKSSSVFIPRNVNRDGKDAHQLWEANQQPQNEQSNETKTAHFRDLFAAEFLSLFGVYLTSLLFLLASRTGSMTLFMRPFFWASW